MGVWMYILSTSFLDIIDLFLMYIPSFKMNKIHAVNKIMEQHVISLLCPACELHNYIGTNSSFWFCDALTYVYNS